MLTKVTITGADDSVDPEELINLSYEYPFLEWAILVSRKSQGKRRFPSHEWMKELHDIGKDIPVAMHLCGDYVNEILMGDTKFRKEVQPIYVMSSRIQINTHGIKHPYDVKKLREVLNTHKSTKFIFQYDEVNTEILDACAGCSNAQALFDLSHGDGVLPNSWPDPIPGVHCGYAGGLSPDNVEDNIIRIENKTVGTPIWIDMETHVISNGDQLFDLKKVKAVLDIAKHYIQ